MKLIKFRIRHYKSIIDTGDCYLANDYTTLIGKNESGKTAVLEALRDFDREQEFIPEEAYPMANLGEEPTLELHFTINATELEKLESKSTLKIPEDVKQKILAEGMSLVKTASGEYKVIGEYGDLFATEEPQKKSMESENPLIELKQKIDELLIGFETPNLVFDQGNDALKGSVKSLVVRIKSNLGLISDEDRREKIVDLVRRIIRESNGDENPPLKNRPQNIFIELIIEILPRFVLFSDLKDILPFEVSMKNLKDNKAVHDFARITNLDMEAVIKTTDIQRRINLLSRYSAKISGDFLGHWGQNEIELIVRAEGEKLLFGVKEAGSTDFFKVAQRSKGFQWFLSFYLCINGYDISKMVLLIDEPGMSLHPLAQKDILNLFKRKSLENMQIIFSTHSPSLIDTNNLGSIRCVVKTPSRGSIVENKLSDDLQEDALIPVRMALASQKTQGISVNFNEGLTNPEILPIESQKDKNSLLDQMEEEDDAENQYGIESKNRNLDEKDSKDEKDSNENNDEGAKEDDIEPPIIKKRRSIFNMFK